MSIRHLKVKGSLNWAKIINENNTFSLIIVTLENTEISAVLAQVKWLEAGEQLPEPMNHFMGQRFNPLYWGCIFAPSVNHSGYINGQEMLPNTQYRVKTIETVKVNEILEEYDTRVEQIEALLNSEHAYKAINIDLKGRGKTEYVQVLKVLPDKQVDCSYRLLYMMSRSWRERVGLRWDKKRQAIAIKPGYSPTSSPCQTVLEAIAEHSFGLNWTQAERWAVRQLMRKEK